MKENILKTNESINSKLSKFWLTMGDIKKEICESINEMLNEMGGEIEVDYANDEYPPVVVYDGGNHPEYASTISAIVQSVKAVEIRGFKTFEVNLEDEPEMSYDRFEFGDVVQIFDFVKARYEDFCENK